MELIGDARDAIDRVSITNLKTTPIEIDVFDIIGLFNLDTSSNISLVLNDTYTRFAVSNLKK